MGVIDEDALRAHLQQLQQGNPGALNGGAPPMLQVAAPMNDVQVMTVTMATLMSGDLELGVPEARNLALEIIAAAVVAVQAGNLEAAIDQAKRVAMGQKRAAAGAPSGLVTAE